MFMTKQRLHLFLLVACSLFCQVTSAQGTKRLWRIFTAEDSTLTLAYLETVPATW